MLENIQSQSNSLRIRWIDALKFFAIFLVVWGHSLQYFHSEPCQHNPIFRFIYGFHMPLFMMISGFFVVHALTKSSYVFIIDKIRQLILPIVSFSVIFLIIRLLSNWVGGFRVIILSMLNLKKAFGFLKVPSFVLLPIIWFIRRVNITILL